MGIAGVALGVLAAVCASPARAATLNVDLSISYDSNLLGQLSGTALLGPSAESLVGTSIDIGSLSQGQSFSTSFLFEPPDPCIAATAGSCQVSFSFSGSALTGGVSAFAFEQLSDATPFPSGPPTTG